MDINQPTSVTAFPPIMPDLHREPPLDFLVMLLPVTLAYSWWPWWMVCPLGHSVGCYPQLGLLFQAPQSFPLPQHGPLLLRTTIRRDFSSSPGIFARTLLPVFQRTAHKLTNSCRSSLMFQPFWIKHSQNPIPGVLAGSCSPWQVIFTTLYSFFSSFEGSGSSQMDYAGFQSVILAVRRGTVGNFWEGSPIPLWKIILMTIL